MGTWVLSKEAKSGKNRSLPTGSAANRVRIVQAAGTGDALAEGSGNSLAGSAGPRRSSRLASKQLTSASGSRECAAPERDMKHKTMPVRGVPKAAGKRKQQTGVGVSPLPSRLGNKGKGSQPASSESVAVRTSTSTGQGTSLATPPRALPRQSAQWTPPRRLRGKQPPPPQLSTCKPSKRNPVTEADAWTREARSPSANVALPTMSEGRSRKRSRASSVT
eukprot:TRINITY_DN6061_c0_g1_i3.p1 TRINITY_DN6061_c0_g1~~TRINITY_DN6061_c0_g1_i3.p1  ORF type:complete len:220 (+),score=33.33 TRINITY_DN6061_c0_g1_i3:43-702(+)